MSFAGETTFKLDEGQRQMTLLALAELSLRRPGFDLCIREIAFKLRGVEMLESFKKTSVEPETEIEKMFKEIEGNASFVRLRVP